MPEFLIKRTDDAIDLPLPSYMSEGAAGMDLYANVTEETMLKPMEIKLIKTGIIISIPNGFEAQIRPRSGLALKHGISMANGIGTIDSDYRGEIGVIMINYGSEPFSIYRGDRIAQMVINEIKQISFLEVSHLDETRRSSGGFGHTGIN